MESDQTPLDLNLPSVGCEITGSHMNLTKIM